MPVNGRARLAWGDQRVEDIMFTWDMHHSEARRGQVGWGIAIEFAAVVEMVKVAADGHATVEACIRS